MKQKIEYSTQHAKMGRIKHIHFIGIGGAGMGGIAEVLLNQGYAVSGSDQAENAMTERLSHLGARIMIGHQAECVDGADVVVVSSAINEQNVEVMKARELRIPLVKRAEMLNELMRFRYGIAIAGTHGKTTTTSLIASLFAQGGLDPTFVIGGRLNSAGSNAHLGHSPYFIVEADESDASFLHLKPMVSVITNIDADHMATYQGDFSKLRKTFVEFLHHLPFYGLAVVCIDDPIVAQILPEIRRPLLTYGFSDEADVQAVEYQQNGFKNNFVARLKKQKLDIPITLNFPGRHNVLNALAAIAVAHEEGVSKEAIMDALLQFQGVGRRLQVYGEYATDKGQVMLIDDYGHHPREVAATLDAVRQAWPDRRLVMAYQPHRFTRTRDLFEDFSQVLSTVDVLLMLDVYSAGENPIEGADSRSLCRNIRAQGAVDPIYVGESKRLTQTLSNILQDGDILLTQGAGSIGTMAADFAKSKLCFA